MGQSQGKAAYEKTEVHPFLNLSPSALETVRVALFQSSPIRVSYGLDENEFCDILSLLMSELYLKPLSERDCDIMCNLSKCFFTVLDTDQNKMIDGLELLTILCVTSAILKVEEKYHFIFRCYDFNDENALTHDEIAFALQSLALGLNKLVCHDDKGENKTKYIPKFALSERDIGRHVENIFELHNESAVATEAEEVECSRITACSWTRVSFDVIVPYCVREFSNWMEYFGEPIEHFVYNENTSNSSPAKVQISAKENHCEGSEPRHLIVNRDSTASSKLVLALNSVTCANETELKGHIFPPPPQLRLEWVNGYSKRGIGYNQYNEVIHFAASIAVVTTRKSEQRHFVRHKAAIEAMAMHPNGILIASADESEDSEIIVWDTVSMEQQVQFLTKCPPKGVSHLAFNGDGTLLASVGNQSGSNLCIHSWETGTVIFSTSTSIKSFCLTFGKNDLIVTCGDRYLYFWDKGVSKGKSEMVMYRKVVGAFGNKKWYDQIQLCATRYRDKIISGSSNGQLFVWTCRKCQKPVNAHKGSIDAIATTDTLIATGGSDKKVCVWTSALYRKATYDLTLLSYAPLVRSLCFSNDKSTIAVGTKSGIHEISVFNGSENQDGAIVSCHFGSELNGLAVHPLKGEYCTGGQDGFLRLWDTTSNKILAGVFMESPIQCVAYDPSGKFICVGFSSLSSSPNCQYRNKEGAFAILYQNGLDVKHEARDSKESVLVATFSPDGETLALGSKDQSIYIYNSGSEYSLLSITSSNYGPVRSIDFSEEGGWIQANASLDNAYFVSLEDYSVVNEEEFSNLKEASWFTQTCPVGWSTAGVRPQPLSGVNISSICRNKAESLLAVGYSNGKVVLTHFPATSIHPDTKIIPGHSSAVTNICFANEDTSIISIGQTDCCVLHWKGYDDSEDSSSE